MKKNFFENLGNTEEKVNENLSFANANLGYTLVQAIIEYIDNAIDAQATQIVLFFYHDSIFIIDNGDGLNDVEKFFKVESMPRKRKRDDIGLFSCGTFSAFSVANRCSIITRKDVKEEPKGISIFYDQKRGGIENTNLNKDALEKWIEEVKDNDEIFEQWKSIVIIDEIHLEKNNIHLEDEGSYFYARLGQRYLERLIKKTLSIRIWNMQNMDDKEKEPIEIQFVDPTFFNEEDLTIKSYHKGAFKFSITMREIEGEIGEEIVDRYYERYVSHYDIDITREKFAEEELFVKYFVLKPIANYKNFIEKNKRYEHYRPGAKSLSSGFYVYRNSIGIGNAAVDKKLQVDFKRQEYNRFKAIIESSPVFDELLGINIRKDDFEIVDALANIISKKLNDSIRNYICSIKKGDNYNNKKLGPCIEVLPELLDDYELKKESNVPVEFNTKNETVDKLEREEIDTSELGVVIQNILSFYSILTDEIKYKIEEWKGVKFDSELTYRKVLKQAKDILENIYKSKRLYWNDLDNMFERVVASHKTQIISSKYPSLTGIDEPRNEQETVFFLVRILQNNKIENNLEIKRTFEYHTQKGIDMIGITGESEEEYNAHIDSILKSCEYLDAEKIRDKYTLLFDYRYTGIEIKYRLASGQNIGHSLATSRFLVAWKIKNGTDTYIDAYDGKYRQVEDDTQNGKGIYIYENEVTQHRIKVIVLKEWGVKNKIFEVKKKYNNT